jgi:hypothetical protein
MAENESIDYKKAWIDLHKESGHISLESAHQINIAHFKAIIDYSKIAINGSFLLNGMAGVAILYNIKSLSVKGYTSLLFCAFGAVFAILCAGISYAAQRAYATTSMKNNELSTIYFLGIMSDIMIKGESKRNPPEFNKPTLGNILSFLACFAWIISVGSFFFAFFNIYFVLQKSL